MSSFKTTRAIPVPPEKIFTALSNPEKLSRWWGPTGFINTFKQFQFRPGGKWSFVMHGPDGRNYPNESEYIEIIPNEKVVIRHISEPKFTLTIIIKGSTQGSIIHWIQEFENAEAAKKLAHIVELGNEQNLDRLTSEVCGS
ncbi:MAG: SRPBCC domain-containing protein [Bacteroidota bacterium]